MPDVVHGMQEEIGNGLPEPETGDDARRHQTKPHFKKMFRERATKAMDEKLNDIDCEIGDDQELHTRSYVEIETETVVFDART